MAAQALSVAWLGTMPAASLAAGVTHDVVIENYRYVPSEITIKAGDTVRWTNREKRTSHSILFKGPQGFESERLFPDESWSRTFDQPGSYPYGCGPHPDMAGHVEVVP